MAWMPAGSPTADELNARLAELKERVRQSRIERGLSPDPPKQKRQLADNMALELLDRMDKFVEVCVEIARLYRASHFVVIDKQRLATYRKCASLLARSSVDNVRDFATKTFLILAYIDSINKRIAEEDEDIANYHIVHHFYGRVVNLRQELSMTKYFIRRGLGEASRQPNGTTKARSAINGR